MTDGELLRSGEGCGLVRVGRDNKAVLFLHMCHFLSGLPQKKLISLAYLLGSDYTDGLEGKTTFIL